MPARVIRYWSVALVAASALGDNTAVIDNCDAMRHTVGFVHVMGGKEDCGLLGFVQVLDVGPELVAGLRVKAESGLVQKQNFWRVQKSASNFQAALHASGKCFDVVVSAAPRVRTISKVARYARLAPCAELCRARRGVPCSRRQSVRCPDWGPGTRFRIFSGLHFSVTVGSSPSSSIFPLVGVRSVVSILMVVVFPAPFGPRKAKISACIDVKGNVIHRGKVAEFLDQVLDSNHELTLEGNAILNGSV